MCPRSICWDPSLEAEAVRVAQALSGLRVDSH
eukprot:CAMPEP_0171125798 /NCGR_PEP_ID=MMETSP0766_2-20121228/111982_1 /TAXON_ID=439317 /ORGANISM="Gambierdiscus australes, Strain CAWD 149" /LENGTH=31 /DNA_ID= /DNA_START= /DNA_END= /DNA_ORIENTATION=